MMAAEDDPRQSSVDLICAVLRFLDAFPTPLVEELHSRSLGRGFLRPFLFCVLSSDASIRQLAAKVAYKLFVENQGETRALDAASQFGTWNQRCDLWKQRQVQMRGPVHECGLTYPSSKVLLDLCERIGTQNETSEIKALRGFLAARLTLLKAIPVCSRPISALFVNDAS